MHSQIQDLHVYNHIITKEIAPAITCIDASSYCHNRVINQGPERPHHIKSPIITTPKKRTISKRSAPQARGSLSTSTLSSLISVSLILKNITKQWNGCTQKHYYIVCKNKDHDRNEICSYLQIKVIHDV